jgi:hypothetical protein
MALSSVGGMLAPCRRHVRAGVMGGCHGACCLDGGAGSTGFDQPRKQHMGLSNAVRTVGLRRAWKQKLSLSQRLQMVLLSLRQTATKGQKQAHYI